MFKLMACNNTYPVMVAGRLLYMPPCSIIINLCVVLLCANAKDPVTIITVQWLATINQLLRHNAPSSKYLQRLNNINGKVHKQAHVSIVASDS